MRRGMYILIAAARKFQNNLGGKLPLDLPLEILALEERVEGEAKVHGAGEGDARGPRQTSIGVERRVREAAGGTTTSLRKRQ
mmetsp:Transcript_51065/g.153494  ORF Transcript_51065/g.153494 Transcript_51065/m.153494 type:complete len:82 (+) Transcript_51065:429-674(+)